jgi:hypothetical protein
LIVSRTMKQHLDAVLPARNFRVTVKSVKARVSLEDRNPYTAFSERNEVRNLLYLPTFQNNLCDYCF